MSYITNSVGPERGPLLWRDFQPGVAIAVLADDASPPNLPIGIAYPHGDDAQGRQLFRLAVRGANLKGLWAVVDRRFVEAEG